MEEISISYLFGSENDMFEAKCRGYKADVIVSILSKKYKLYVYDIVRLSQDFHDEIEECGFFQSEPNMIVVNSVTDEEIKRAVRKLYEQGYFNLIGEMHD